MLQMPFKTCAKAAEPKKPPFLMAKQCLGLTPEGKIDLFVFTPENMRADDKMTEGNEYSISTSMLVMANRFGLSTTNISLLDKINQLGLLCRVCHFLGIKPGISYTNDKAILQELQNALSDNIINKEEVIQEFIALWNEIAALPWAADNLGIRNNNLDAFKPLFSYHENYELTVGIFCGHLATLMVQSEHFKDLTLKVMSQLGQLTTEQTLKQKILLGKVILIESLLASAFHPRPINDLSQSIYQPYEQLIQKMSATEKSLEQASSKEIQQDAKELSIEAVTSSKSQVYTPSLQTVRAQNATLVVAMRSQDAQGTGHETLPPPPIQPYNFHPMTRKL